MVGQRPKEPDRIGKMEWMIRDLDPTSAWRRLPKSSFEGTNSQRKAAADKYVRDAYNALPRKEHIKYFDRLILPTRVDMVLLCLLTWYHELAPERKASFGQKGPEVP
jgi:hypothetical protein